MNKVKATHKDVNQSLVLADDKRRKGVRAASKVAELSAGEQTAVAGGTLLDGPITGGIHASLVAGTTGGGTSHAYDYKSLWTFTTLATTPTCAVIIAVTFTKCG